MKRLLIGLDFSINKPALTYAVCGDDGKIERMGHSLWLMRCTKKVQAIHEKYFDFVWFENRDLDPIGRDVDYSDGVAHKTFQASVFATDIVSRILTIESEVNDGDIPMPIYVASEGLSFNSNGASGLDLASYKSVLYAEIYKELLPLERVLEDKSKEKLQDYLVTFSPMAVKTASGCTKKDKRGDKNAVVDAFVSDSLTQDLGDYSDFVRNIPITHKSKTNYIMGMDDIADSFFVFKLLYNRIFHPMK